MMSLVVRRRSKLVVLVVCCVAVLALFAWKSRSAVGNIVPVSRSSDDDKDDVTHMQSVPWSTESYHKPPSLSQNGHPFLENPILEVEKSTRPSHPNSITTTSTLQSSDTPPSNRTMTILQDLERCSRALGVTERSLHENRARMVEVSRRAELFLGMIGVMLPESYSKRFTNPCWFAKEPEGYMGWEKDLKSYFTPQLEKIPRRSGESFEPLVSKPVDETYTGKKRLICLPSFFLAGFPKCASTTIHGALSKHPEIIPPSGKEPHYWTKALRLSRPEDFNTEYVSISFMTYTLFFTKISSLLAASPNPNRSFITYDGSQSTLWDSNLFFRGQEYCAMPAVISRVLPSAKFIVVLRNPVTRLYSHFMFSNTLLYGRQVEKWPLEVRENASRIFHVKVMKEIEAFKICLEKNSTYECASNHILLPKHGTLGRLHRMSIGLYATHIRKWLQFYSRENFLFIRTEDISQNAVKIVSKITKFLGVAPVSEEVVGGMFSKEKNVFDTSAHHLAPMDQHTKALLEEFYQPYNEELARLLNDGRFLWKDS